MIDLHCHILHGIDDGARDLRMSLEMARQAVDDGVEVIACTPHFLPGVYDPGPAEVLGRVAELNCRLIDAGIDLAVVAGCEAHVRPDMVKRLDEGNILPIHNSRFVLCEAPAVTLPPHLDQLFTRMISAGYSPVLAHVERYRWAEQCGPWIRRMSEAGVLMQVTAGSLLGNYGSQARELSRRLLSQGLVDVIASDAHDTSKRAPGLRRAFDLVASERGGAEAIRIFRERPAAILLQNDEGHPTRLLEPM